MEENNKKLAEELDKIIVSLQNMKEILLPFKEKIQQDEF